VIPASDVDCGFGIWTANQSLRLLGIDAPELGKPGGIEARDYLRKLVPVGSSVVIRTVKDENDKYGRLLANITATGVDGDSYNVNQRMVSDGHAVPYFGGKR
jgi:endonuclease YncB( thermonuclease family)